MSNPIDQFNHSTGEKMHILTQAEVTKC